MLTNSRAAFGWIAIALHWIAAAGMLVLWYTGEGFEHSVGRPARMAALGQHVTIGMVLFVFLAARVIWSLTQPKPEPLETRRIFVILARAVQWLFLAQIAVLILTGPLAIWSMGRPLELTNGLIIPSPLPRFHPLHEACEQVHALASNLLWPLLALHVLGALKHLVFDRDRTVQRMLWVKRA